MIIHKLKSSRILQAVLVTGVALLAYLFAPESMPEPARRVLFVFIWAAFFWAFEIIPLYATSLMTVLLLTFFLCRPNGIMGMDDQGYTIFMLPFGSHIIMLFFGGLIIAEAMRKYSMDQFVASRVLKFFGTHPYFILLGFILITAFLSMWMSNTATTVMMIALIKPLFSQIQKDDPFRTGLVLSIPFAANIGGMGTPIGSPPNAIALGVLSDQGIVLSFVSWMMMAIPLMIVILIGISFILIKMFPPKNSKVNLVIDRDIPGFGHKNKIVGLFVVLTILMWLTFEFHKVPAALIALTSGGLLAAFGFIVKDDFKNIDWAILILMWGGLALGKGLEISGLSSWIVGQPIFAQQGIMLVVVFILLTIAMSTFISNTATANLIIPIAVAVPGQDPVVLTVIIALCCAFGMALPVSTPPNTIAYSSGVLKSADMAKAGVLVGVLGLIVMSIGFKFVVSLLGGTQ